MEPQLLGARFMLVGSVAQTHGSTSGRVMHLCCLGTRKAGPRRDATTFGQRSRRFDAGFSKEIHSLFSRGAGVSDITIPGPLLRVAEILTWMLHMSQDHFPGCSNLREPRRCIRLRISHLVISTTLLRRWIWNYRFRIVVAHCSASSPVPERHTLLSPVSPQHSNGTRDCPLRTRGPRSRRHAPI